MATFRTLKRTSLLDDFVADVEERVLTGELQVGERLPPEAELVRAYGVSRTVVREGLAQLRERGLVTTANGRGTVVRHPGPDDLSAGLVRQLRLKLLSGQEREAIGNLYEARSALESTAMRQAALEATDEDLMRLEKSLDDMSRSVEDAEKYAQADVKFHLGVVRASHNPFLVSLLGPLIQAISVCIETQHGHDAVVSGLRSHRLLIEALRAGDPISAGDAMSEHLAESRVFAQGAFAAQMVERLTQLHKL